MATKSKLVMTGVHIWWKTTAPLVVWTELGRNKADAFLTGSAIAKSFLLMIPVVGPILYAIKSQELNNAKTKLGPNGLWIKSGIGMAQRVYRPRTAQNMHKAPSPW